LGLRTGQSRLLLLVDVGVFPRVFTALLGHVLFDIHHVLRHRRLQLSVRCVLRNALRQDLLDSGAHRLLLAAGDHLFLRPKAAEHALEVAQVFPLRLQPALEPAHRAGRDLAA
jgi:hypothetical protein